jgi:RNA polymerase sigma factor (TIGR02999 family)
MNPADDDGPLPDAPDGEQVARLLEAWNAGDRSALDGLLPLVHSDLKRMARRLMSRERTGHTLQPTALVHEAYVRLAGERGMQWQNRAHFLAVTAQLMRFILVDHARRRGVAKRGGDLRRVSIDDVLLVSPDAPGDLLALDEALEALAANDPRKAKVVEMRLFGGLSVEESAAVLGVSGITVMRDWRFARAWLQQRLGP